MPGDGVSSPNELRSYAVDCARLAQSATDPRDKARLLTMARNWTDLASRIEQLGQVADHISNVSADLSPKKPRDN